MRRRCSLLALFVTASLAGCAAVYSEGINPPPRAMRPRAVAEVEVFSASRPTRPFVDVAVLVANPSLDGYIANLRDTAAAMGCDGIVLGAAQIGRRSGSMQATCIVYQTPTAAPASTPQPPAPPVASTPPTAAEPAVTAGSEGQPCALVADTKSVYMCRAGLGCRDGTCVRLGGF